MIAERQIDQHALVRMALRLGSDYTEGVRGIGISIINALEVKWPSKGRKVCLKRGLRLGGQRCRLTSTPWYVWPPAGQRLH